MCLYWHTHRERANQWINTRNFACRHIFGSCSLCFLSASRQNLAMVRAQKLYIPNLALALVLILAPFV